MDAQICDDHDEHVQAWHVHERNRLERTKFEERAKTNPIAALKLAAEDAHDAWSKAVDDVEAMVKGYRKKLEAEIEAPLLRACAEAERAYRTASTRVIHLKQAPKGYNSNYVWRASVWIKTKRFYSPEFTVKFFTKRELAERWLAANRGDY